MLKQHAADAKELPMANAGITKDHGSGKFSNEVPLEGVINIQNSFTASSIKLLGCLKAECILFDI